MRNSKNTFFHATHVNKANAKFKKTVTVNECKHDFFLVDLEESIMSGSSRGPQLYQGDSPAPPTSSLYQGHQSPAPAHLYPAGGSDSPAPEATSAAAAAAGGPVPPPPPLAHHQPSYDVTFYNNANGLTQVLYI